MLALCPNPDKKKFSPSNFHIAHLDVGQTFAPNANYCDVQRFAIWDIAWLKFKVSKFRKNSCQCPKCWQIFLFVFYRIRFAFKYLSQHSFWRGGLFIVRMLNFRVLPFKYWDSSLENATGVTESERRVTGASWRREGHTGNLLRPSNNKSNKHPQDRFRGSLFFLNTVMHVVYFEFPRLHSCP